MLCNLNFNQCFSGCPYPRPIFTCYRNLIALLNQSGTTIINPTIEVSSAITQISSPQTVTAGGLVVPSLTFSQGSSIIHDNAGTFTLTTGRYLINYNLNGIISANGLNSYTVYLDGNIIPSSQSSTSGTIGSGASLSGSAFVRITNVAGAITIRNTNINPLLINSGSVTIQKIN